MSFMLFFIVSFAAFVTVAALMFVIAYILIKGIPHITPQLFEKKYTT